MRCRHHLSDVVSTYTTLFLRSGFFIQSWDQSYWCPRTIPSKNTCAGVSSGEGGGLLCADDDRVRVSKKAVTTAFRRPYMLRRAADEKRRPAQGGAMLRNLRNTRSLDDR